MTLLLSKPSGSTAKTSSLRASLLALFFSFSAKQEGGKKEEAKMTSRYLRKGPAPQHVHKSLNLEEWYHYRENTHRYFRWNAQSIRFVGGFLTVVAGTYWLLVRELQVGSFGEKHPEFTYWPQPLWMPDPNHQKYWDDKLKQDEEPEIM